MRVSFGQRHTCHIKHSRACTLSLNRKFSRAYIVSFNGVSMRVSLRQRHTCHISPKKKLSMWHVATQLERVDTRRQRERQRWEETERETEMRGDRERDRESWLGMLGSTTHTDWPRVKKKKRGGKRGEKVSSSSGQCIWVQAYTPYSELLSMWWVEFFFLQCLHSFFLALFTPLTSNSWACGELIFFWHCFFELSSPLVSLLFFFPLIIGELAIFLLKKGPPSLARRYRDRYKNHAALAGVSTLTAV